MGLFGPRNRDDDDDDRDDQRSSWVNTTPPDPRTREDLSPYDQYADNVYNLDDDRGSNDPDPGNDEE